MRKKSAIGSTWVDPDDAPRLTKEFFEQADVYHGEKLLRRGRPPTGNAKQLVSIRLDKEVLAGLRALGAGWQTRANDLLREFLKLDSNSPSRSQGQVVWGFRETGRVPVRDGHGAVTGEDRADRGAQDRTRINVHEDYEVQYWTRKWDVSPAQLKEAVSKVGVSVKAVANALGKEA